MTASARNSSPAVPIVESIRVTASSMTDYLWAVRLLEHPQRRGRAGQHRSGGSQDDCHRVQSLFAHPDSPSSVALPVKQRKAHTAALVLTQEGDRERRVRPCGRFLGVDYSSQTLRVSRREK